MDDGCISTPRPVDPALSQWLRQSFSFTPKTPLSTSTSAIPRTPLRSAGTGTRESRNPSLRPASTRRKRTEHNASVEEETLPAIKKRTSRRNKADFDNKALSQSDSRVGRSGPASSVACTTTTTRGQGRRMILEAVEITKPERPSRSTHVLDDWTQMQDYAPGSSAPSALPVGESVSVVPQKPKTRSSTRRTKTPNTCRRDGADRTLGKRTTCDKTQGDVVNSHLSEHRRSSVSRSRFKRDDTLSVSTFVTSEAPPKTSKYFTVPYQPAASFPTPKSTIIADTNTKLTELPILTPTSAEIPACRTPDPTKRSISVFHISSQEKHDDLVKDFMVMLQILKPKLIQEAVCHDPWKVLLAVRLLNVTTGRMAIPVFWKIMHRWPTPQRLVDAPLDELIEFIRPLGLYNKRAKWFKDISRCYIEDPPRYFINSSYPSPDTCAATSIKPACKRKTRSSYPDTPISHFPGVGPYAFDSFRIFCTSSYGPGVEARAEEEWKHVMPSDKELIRYLRWKWAYEEQKIWYPIKGVIGDVNLPYLISLVDELAEHYDTTVGGEGYIDTFIGRISGNC